MRRAHRLGLLLALFVLVSFATRWLSLVVHVIDMDESAHIVGSWEMMRGGLLYTDFVDNKPPLLYVCYALAQWLCSRSLIGVHAFAAALVVPLTAFAVSSFYRHDRRGVIAAAVYLVYGVAFLGHDMLASNAEIFMLLPATWALVAASTAEKARRHRAQLAAGALLGAAFLVKYQAAAWLPAIAIATMVAAQPKPSPTWVASRLASLSGAFALPLLATWAWFYARGGDRAFLYWTLSNNLAYANNPIGWLEAAGRATGYLLPFLVVTGPLWWAAWRSRSMEEEGGYQRLLVGATVLLSLGPALIGFRFYPHYFVQLYVPLALAAAPWLQSQLWAKLTRAGRAVVAWSAFWLLGFEIVNAVLYLGPFRVYQETSPVYHLVAARLRADRCFEGATLFVWGYAVPFYYHARLPIASRFAVLAQSGLTGYVPGYRGNHDAEGDGGPMVEERWNELLSDLERRRATYILDTAPAGIYGWNRFPIENYPRLRDYVRERYEAIDTIGRVVVFRRIGCEGSGRISDSSASFRRSAGIF